VPPAAERLVEVDDGEELIALCLCERALRRVEELQGFHHLDVVREADPVPRQRQIHKGTVSLVGLPPGDFPTPIFDVVLKRITVRGSIVGTRADLAEAIGFAAGGRVRAHVHRARLDDINRVLSDLRTGNVEGRIVLDVA
jgi:propanol-preferring alcohol dehydrogenase